MDDNIKNLKYESSPVNLDLAFMPRLSQNRSLKNADHADCRQQTVQTVQTEYFFSYTSSRNYFRLTFFSSSFKILLDISVCLLFIISDRDVLALDGGCPGTRKPKWRMTVTKHCTLLFWLCTVCVRMEFRLL